jgi:hypothetical protein
MLEQACNVQASAWVLLTLTTSASVRSGGTTSSYINRTTASADATCNESSTALVSECATDYVNKCHKTNAVSHG